VFSHPSPTHFSLNFLAPSSHLDVDDDVIGVVGAFFTTTDGLLLLAAGALLAGDDSGLMPTLLARGGLAWLAEGPGGAVQMVV